MSVRRLAALKAMAESADPGTAAAARHAIARHNAKLLAEPDPVDPPGPDLTRRGGPFSAREVDGVVWVAVRGASSRHVAVGPVASAESYVAERRRMMVSLGGERWAMVPTAVEIDHERQTVHVTAERETLVPWE